MIKNLCLKHAMKNIIPLLICIGNILPAQAESLNINSKKQEDGMEIIISRTYGPVKRIYCSVKSIGFDIHFNSQTGFLYSYDDFLDKLIPFSLFNETKNTKFQVEILGKRYDASIAIDPPFDPTGSAMRS